MSTNDEVILAAIKANRAENNDLWMQIVAIALKHAPEETKKVMQEIGTRDKSTNVLWGRLCKS